MSFAEPTSDPSAPTFLSRLAALGRRFGRAALDMVYPPQCVACGEIDAEPAALCAACWRAMPFITRPFCERTGVPFAVDIGGPLLSPQAIADPPVYRAARAVARHDGAAKAMAHRLKYGDRQELALAMARLMTGAAGDLVARADVLVPIPLHWTRLFRRRFNQAAALAARMSEISGKPMQPELLRRRKRTRQQVGLTRAERQQNVQGAFLVTEEARARVKGLSVLLVDDVLTTGSTANAAARVLLRAGAANVDVVSFSRVVTAA
jgi:ComF family protein